MNAGNRENFTRCLVYLGERLFDFSGRPYLSAIYGSTARNLVLRCSRQVEKSTFLANYLLHAAATRPGTRLLLVCPRLDQARLFVRERLQPRLAESPVLQRYLLGTARRPLPLTHIVFHNGSRLFVQAAYRSADSIRGISADILLVDEFQDIAAGDLPVLQEALSHSPLRQTILSGTPKLNDNHLEAMFNESTANEWLVPCPACAQTTALDERCLGPKYIQCLSCAAPLNPAAGQWVARNPQASWGDGFSINALMVPWRTNYAELLECQRTYDVARFRNEVLGLPVSLGDHVVTLEQLIECCGDSPLAGSVDDVPQPAREQIVVGIDWGGGAKARTAIVVGFARPDAVFEICYLTTLPAQADPEVVVGRVVETCRRFQARWVAADGCGNGSIYNRQLAAALGNSADVYALPYVATDGTPEKDGSIRCWPISRTRSIGHLIAVIHKQKLRLPRLADCRSYLDEFACEVAEYDELNRRIRFTCPNTHRDDTLHATNYALHLATWGFRRLTQKW